MFGRMPTRLLPGLAALCLAGTAGCASTTETRSAPEPTGDNRAELGDYKKAFASCRAQAVKQITGRVVRSAEEQMFGGGPL